MATPFLVPCLVALRTTVNGRFPRRDKASDGWIADAAHVAAGTSKHIPDSAGRVHALDLDADLRDDAGVSMQDVIDRILHNQRYGDGRLQNVIYRRRIWSRSWGWTPREYTGINAHLMHAHFEARTVDSARNSTYPWPMPPHPIPEDDDMTPAQFLSLLQDPDVAARMKQLAGQGVHNQKLGASDETIGADLQSDDGVLAARFDAIDQKLDTLLGLTSPPAPA
jgi:hypothetical protein